VLSRRFGVAHLYHLTEDGTAWCIAEHGNIVRYFCQGDPEQIGSPHPAEEGCSLPVSDEEEDSWDAPRHDAWLDQLEHRPLCFADTIAERASVDPSQLGPHIRVEGHGVLARTARGRRQGFPPGVLPL
jgi:hypothetical protein